jgi:hypothetical protein
MSITREQTVAALEFYKAVAEAIRDLSAVSPLGGVPSGELYVRLSGVIGIESYKALLDSLEGAKLIKVKGHLITWIGPKA